MQSRPIRNSNDEARRLRFFRCSWLEFILSFDILSFAFFSRNSSTYLRLHSTIASPRAGPTLIMDGFAPASSEMYLTYFLADDGSCENSRAVCIEVFQPATSS